MSKIHSNISASANQLLEADFAELKAKQEARAAKKAEAKVRQKAKKVAMASQPVPAPPVTGTEQDVTVADNDPIEWNANVWLADFIAALDAGDSDQQDALGEVGKQAMEDAQQRGDADRVHSISTAAAKAKHAQEEAQRAAVEAMRVADHEAGQREAQGDLANLPSVEFGKCAASRTEAPATISMPLQRAHEGDTPIMRISTVVGGLSLRLGSDDSPEFEAEVRAFIMEGAAEEAKELCHAKLGKIAKLTGPSNALLGLIVREFASHSTNNTAYRLSDGQELQQPGFKNYCRKHYGDVFGTDAGGTIVREFAGEVWWRQIGDKYRVITKDDMDPTSKPDDPDSDVFNRWYVLKETMVKPDMTATRADIKIFDDQFLKMAKGCVVTREYMLDWMSYLRQKPDSKPSTSLVIVSPEEGTGKTWLATPLKWIFGPDLVMFTGGEAIYDPFDCPFVHKRITFLDEMPRPEKMRATIDPYARLKRLITARRTTLKRKHRPAEETRIPALVITLNEIESLADFADGRRFCIVLNTDPPEDKAYYDRLWAQTGEDEPGPGMAKLAGYLMKRDISKWNPNGDAPQTSAKAYVRQVNRSAEAEFIQRLIEGRDPDLIPGSGSANPFAKDIGRVTSILLGLSGYPPVVTNGLRFTDKSVIKALRELGYRQVNEGAATASDKAWCWRKFDYWESKKPRHYNAYIKDGTTPDDYPKTEASDDEN